MCRSTPSPATVVSVSDTRLVIRMPAHAPTVVGLTVTNPDARDDLGTERVHIRPVRPRRSARSSPSRGGVEGGNSVTITGTGFAPGASVAFDGVAAALSPRGRPASPSWLRCRHMQRSGQRHLHQPGWTGGDGKPRVQLRRRRAGDYRRCPAAGPVDGGSHHHQRPRNSASGLEGDDRRSDGSRVVLHADTITV